MRQYLIVVFLLAFAVPTIGQTITPAGPHALCTGGSVTLTSSAGDSYQWRLNGNPINGATSRTYVANAAGAYSVIVTTNNVAATSGNVTVTVPGSPVPSFTYPGGTLCAGSIQLNGSATGGTPGYTYAWSFGGGGTSTTQNPVHSFNALGCGNTTQPATLTVTDANGCTGTLTQNLTMQQAPDISLEDLDNPFLPFNNCNNNPAPGNANFTVRARINSSSTCATNYSINWGDGSPVQTGLSNGATVNHTYTTIGAFNLVLTATGTNGCTRSRTYVVANQSNPDIGIGTIGTTIGCADLPVNIEINLWQGNSAGTTYLLEYGDGEIKEMTHPINASNVNELITHTYKTSPCPTIGLDYYTIRITATNACNPKIFQGGNIRVYSKPIAAFSTGSACAGQATCFNNETIAGHYAGCSTTANYSWNFGDPGSGASNTSTLANPCHTFSAPGNYDVTLNVTNACGTSTFTERICVNPTTTSAFTVNNNDVCAGTTVTTTNLSTLGSCVSAGYSWDVTYTSGFCGTTPGWSYASGTSTSATPSFKFDNPGTYTVRLRITGACGNSTSQQIVHVKEKPSVTLNPIGNVCGQTTISPTATFINCGADPLTYSWKIDGTELSTAANPGALNISAGNHTIELTATNECGSDIKTQTFSNNTGAALTAPASAVICGGDNSGNFDFTTTPAAPVTWTNDHPEIGLPASGSGNIPSFITTNNTTSAIVATIAATATLNNCPDTKTFTVTVNPKPALPVVVSPVNYCDNETATPLTATALSGHQLRWYTTATGGTASATAPTPPTATFGTTTYYVSQYNTTTNCEGDRAAITVNVSFVPTVGSSTSGSPTACATPTGFIELTGLTASYTFDVRYTKNGGAPTTLSLSSNASGTIRIPNLTAATYTDVVVINNGCVSNASGPFTLIDPNPPPPPTPGAAIAICEGLTLSLTATSTEAPITWNWAGPNGFTSTQQNPAITGALPTHSGVYAVNIVKDNCPSAPANLNVTIYPRPVAPTVSATTSTCLKSDLQLNATTSFAGPVSWSWTGPNGFTSTDQNPLITNSTNAMAGNYQVTVTSNLGTCTSPAAITAVTIMPIPVVTSASYINPIGCNTATGSLILNGLLSSTLYSVQYSFNGTPQAPVNATSAPDGTLIVGGMRAGTYTNVRLSFNGCTSDPYGPYVLEGTAPFSVITSTNGELCEGSTLILNARATDPGAATYSWTGPNGFTSNIQNPTIPNAGVINAGAYEATITINGCSGKSSVTAVISSETIAGNTGADASVCPGQNNGIITLNNYHGRVLRWESSLNNGQSWNPVANTSSSLNYNDITATTSYRAVVQSGVCASRISDVTTITVLPGVRSTTMQPEFIETCNHDTLITFSSTAINDGPGALTYYWQINGDVQGTTNPFTYNFRVPEPALNATEFSVVAIAENGYGCNNSSEAGRVLINAIPYPKIDVNPAAIQREPKYTFTFTDASPHGASDVYTWNVGDSGRIKTGREITHDYKRTGTFKVNLYVEDKSTGCNARDSIEVTIVPVPGFLTVPNAFYPGSNVPEIRTFKIKGTGLKKYRLQIFDAWGKVVFETTELNADGSPKVAWNGNYMNTERPMPQDAYMWKVTEVEFENGKPWPGMSHNGGTPKNFGNLTLFR